MPLVRMTAASGIVAKHTTTSLHVKQKEAVHIASKQGEAKKQLDLVQSGMKRASALCVSSLVAGGRGADGLPYSSIPRLLNLDVLKMLARAGGLCISATTLRAPDAPAAVVMVRERVKEVLRGVSLAIAIDGGSSNLAGSSKVVMQVATSPGLDFDLTVQIDVLPRHETAEIQAAALEYMRESYGLTKEQSRPRQA